VRPEGPRDRRATSHGGDGTANFPAGSFPPALSSLGRPTSHCSAFVKWFLARLAEYVAGRIHRANAQGRSIFDLALRVLEKGTGLGLFSPLDARGEIPSCERKKGLSR
jgi:hypothetical protein